MKKTIVFKIGGSLLYDKNLVLKVDFLGKVKAWYEKNKKSYNKIVIFVGGGKLSRWLGGQIKNYTDGDDMVHGVALQTNILNAQLMKGLLGDEEIYVPSDMGNAFEAILSDNVKTIIAGGLKRGWSTDMDIAVIGDILGQKKVYKLSEIDHIYTADPDKDKNAMPLINMTWKEYYNLFDIIEGVSNHKPNQSLPIDLGCAQFCAKKGISFVVSGGKNFMKKKTLDEVFESGTLVYPN